MDFFEFCEYIENGPTIDGQTEPPAHWPEEMKAEWRKDRDLLLGDSWSS